MSVIYNRVKNNVDKINSILSTLISNRFKESGSWISPITGIVTLNGTGNGQNGFLKDGRIPTDGMDLSKSTIPLDYFDGGYFRQPTTVQYPVIAGKLYSIHFDSDMYCIFNEEIKLGNVLKKARSIAVSETISEYHVIGKDTWTYKMTQKSPDGIDAPVEPRDGKDGMGGSGCDLVCFSSMDFNVMNGTLETQFKILSVTQLGGKGGSGFLEISYPKYHVDKILMDSDLFSELENSDRVLSS